MREPRMEIYDFQIEVTEAYEGFRGDPYNDHLGNPTIGYGTLLPITRAEARLLLRSRMEAIWAELYAKPPIPLSELRYMLPDAVTAICDMAYNMGVPRLRGFKKMWAALEKFDYATAADEVLNSRYAKQVGRRAVENANRFRECHWDGGEAK